MTGINDYFNHSQYRDGWTYNNLTIGTPFISSKRELIPALQNSSLEKPHWVNDWAIRNNRVTMFYIATIMEFAGGHLLEVRGGVSQNNGLYRRPFQTVAGQTSGLIRLIIQKGSWGFTSALSADGGDLIPPTMGVWISIKRTW